MIVCHSELQIVLDYDRNACEVDKVTLHGKGLFTIDGKSYLCYDCKTVERIYVGAIEAGDGER